MRQHPMQIDPAADHKTRSRILDSPPGDAKWWWSKWTVPEEVSRLELVVWLNPVKSFPGDSGIDIGTHRL